MAAAGVRKDSSSTIAKSFYAHSVEGRAKSDWQTLQEHLQAVGELAAIRAAKFGAAALGRAAGLLHDLGKYTVEFQSRLEGSFPRMDHATRGALVAGERYGLLGKLLAYGVAGHHAGLPNGTNGISRSSLTDRLASRLHELQPQWQDEIFLPPGELGLPDNFSPLRSRGAFQLTLLARMVYSCLVDADFIDTDNFYRRVEKTPLRVDDGGPSLDCLRDRLNQALSGFQVDTDINRLRARILNHVRSQAVDLPGLFSLTVPTGGGKTLASLAFALDHAIAHGLRRVIYVIPFTSVVEQSAQVFRDALGELGDAAVLEHHSAFIDNPRQAPESKDKRKLAMENWDAPIVVTTAVQFFESLFADRPARCRKLHNIAASVVILDEAQTLPLKLLRPCVTLLDELALNYRTSIVLCTATQPALNAEDGFLDGLKGVRELAPEPKRLYQQLRGVHVRHAGVLDDEALAQHLRNREQILCIVNSRRHAHALFDAIAELPGAFHLSTLMCAKHRREVLQTVRQRLKAKMPCRLVSTSLIEAGVDIDLQCVLRAEAGLDSIAQAAGRCNRERARPPSESEVLVFTPGNPDWQPPREVAQFAQAFRAIERVHREDLLAPEAIRAYFQELYWQKGSRALDEHQILDQLARANHDNLPFETLAAQFRVIETTMRPVIIPFDEKAQEALRSLAFVNSCGSIARDLQPYLVQVPQQAYDALWKAHAIQPIAQEKFGDQFVALANLRLYDSRIGLHWEEPQFLAVESTIW